MSSSPTDFHSEKIGLIRVINCISIRVKSALEVIYTQALYITVSLSFTDVYSEKKGLIRVTKYLNLSVLRLKVP